MIIITKKKKDLETQACLLQYSIEGFFCLFAQFKQFFSVGQSCIPFVSSH